MLNNLIHFTTKLHFSKLFSARTFCNRGYDVWLGNTRGGRYSRSHLTLSPDQPEFWNITFTKVGSSDYAAMIDYILIKTGRPKLYFIGYSAGTSEFFPLVTQKPEYNDKIIVASLMAPAIFLNHMGANGSAFETFLQVLWVIPILNEIFSIFIIDSLTIETLSGKSQ